MPHSGNINKYEKTDEFHEASDTNNFSQEFDYKAGENPVVYNVKSSILGVAIFKKGKLVDSLSANEALAHLLLSGNFESSYLVIKDPKNENSTINLEVTSSKKPKIETTISDNKTYVHTEIVLNAKVISMGENSDYSSEDDIKNLEISANNYLKDLLNDYIDKTKEHNVDTVGYGRHFIGKFLTYDKWLEFNWLEKYKDTSFDINVDTKIKTSTLLLKSS